jgi:hypothetical protein
VPRGADQLGAFAAVDWERALGWLTGGDLDQDDPDAVGVLDPHLDQAQGSVAGSRMTGTLANDEG